MRVGMDCAVFVKHSGILFLIKNPMYMKEIIIIFVMLTDVIVLNYSI